MRRRSATLALLPLVLAAPAGAGASAPPIVAGVFATLDPTGRVDVSYDLADADDDSLEVSLRLSLDGGTHFLAGPDSVSGDVGFPVSPGSARTLSWHVRPGELRGGAVEVVARVVAVDRDAVDLHALVDGADSSRVRADLERIAGVRHHGAALSNLQATRDYIEGTFRAHGLRTRRHAFPHGSWNGENVIGTIPGDLDEAATYAIDGHFDTVTTTPGADDNASGVAGFLEAMRLLSAHRFARTIEFIGFDLEEVGIVGSLRYVESGIPAHQRIEGVVNFEMIGYTCREPGCDQFAPLGDYIHNISNTHSNPLRLAFDAAAASYVPGLAILSTEGDPDTNPNLRRSDHARFWDAGMRALFLTDGANFRNPNYHQGTDRNDTIDLAFLTNVVRTTVAAIAELAGIHEAGSAESAPFFVDPSPVEGTSWGRVKGAYP